jgi:hypothetical protein
VKKKSTDTRLFLHSLNPAGRSAELQAATAKETENKIKQVTFAYVSAVDICKLLQY